MSEEQKLCPFCYSDEIHIDEFGKFFVIGCEGCGTDMVMATSETEAMEIWNTRPIEDDLNIQITDLKSEIDVLRKELAEAKNKLITANLVIDQLSKCLQ